MFRQSYQHILLSLLISAILWSGSPFIQSGSQSQANNLGRQPEWAAGIPPANLERAVQLAKCLAILERRGDDIRKLMQSQVFQQACLEAGVTGTFEDRVNQLKAVAETVRIEAQTGMEPIETPVALRQTAGLLPETFYQTLPEIPVTNGADTGPGSLRQAVLDADVRGGNCRIVFNLDKTTANRYDPVTGTFRITVNSAIISKSPAVFIDGFSQAEFGGDTNPKGPEIVLEAKNPRFPAVMNVDGELIVSGFVFVLFDSDGSWIRGFCFDTGKPGDLAIGAVNIESGRTTSAIGNRISDCFIGIDPTGERLTPGGENDGISIFGSSIDGLIENNIISATIRDIELTGNASFPTVNPNSVNNVIRNNKLDTNLSGTRRVAGVARIGSTGTAGVSIDVNDGAINNIVENNLVGGTRMGGIGFINERGIRAQSQNIFRNNRIGIGRNGENIGPPPTCCIPGPNGSTDPGEQGMYAVGIYATPQDTVQNNTIANFALCGIMMRDQNGNPRYGPGLIQGNTIRNCGMGIQIGQMTNGAMVKQNVFDTCSQGGIVVAEDMFDAALIYAAQYQPRPVPNPTGLPSVLIAASENSFSNITGPGIALVRDVKTIIGGTYTPNTATQVISGFGPNEFQPTPILSMAQRQANGSITLTGQTVGAGMLEIYNSSRPARPSAPDSDVMAYGLGTFLQSINVGGGPFAVTIPASQSQNVTMLTATVTVSSQTSEFARTVAVETTQPPLDTIPPTVTVTAPTAGQQIESKAGTQVSIVWQSSDNVGVVRHDIRLASLIPNGTPTLELIASGLAGTAQSFTWSVPENLDIPQAMVNVEAADAAGNKGSVNSGVFTVKKPVVVPPDTEKPVVTNVTLSKKKVKRNVDPTVTISWKSTDNVGVTTQDVLYATDGTNFSLTVAAGLPGTAQSFTWTVPNTLAKSKIGVVKVVAKDAAGNAVEAVSNPFVIK